MAYAIILRNSSDGPIYKYEHPTYEDAKKMYNELKDCWTFCKLMLILEDNSDE